MERNARRLGTLQGHPGRRYDHQSASTGENGESHRILSIISVSYICTQGTWQFLSAALLQFSRIPIGIADEVESLFYIVVYNGVRYFRSSVKDPGAFLMSFFDSFSLENSQYKCGVTKMSAMANGTIKVGTQPLMFFRDSMELRREDPHPFDVVLEKMMPIFKARYDLLQHKRDLVHWRRKVQKLSFKEAMAVKPPNPPPSVSEDAKKLDSHSYFRSILSELLQQDNWPKFDYLGDRIASDPATLSNAGTDDQSEDGDADLEGEEDDEDADDDDESRPFKRTKEFKEVDDLMLYGSDSDSEASEDEEMDAPPSPLAGRSSSSSFRTGRGIGMRGVARQHSRRS